MATFTGKRMRRPRLAWAAILTLIATPAVCVEVALAFSTDSIGYPAVGGLILFYVLMFASIIPRPTTLEVAGREVRVPWRELSVARVEVGRWLMAGVDTPMGPLLELYGSDGTRLRVGGEEHDARGFARGRGRRSVDVALAAADFDALAAALQVPREGGLAVELVASSQTGAAVFRTMLPWLVTMVVAGAIGASGLFEIMTGAIVAGGVIVIGLATTIVLSMRPRRAGITIAVGDAGLGLLDGAGSPRAPGASVFTRGQHPRRREDENGDVTPWAAVRAGTQTHFVRMKGSSWTMPALTLSLGSRELTFCAWGAKAEQEGPRLRGTPRWLAGPAQYASLVAELRRRRVV